MTQTINERGEYKEETCRNLVARIWSENDCWGDYRNYQNCMHLIKNYDRKQAISLLRELIRQYRVQMDEWAFLCGEQYIQPSKAYESDTSIQILCDLHYIGFHIPAYALLREGKNEEAERMMHWMEGMSYGKACHRV